MPSSSPPPSLTAAATCSYYKRRIEEVWIIAQEHEKNGKSRPAHCHTCWHAALIRCVRLGRLKDAEDLLRPARVLGTPDEVRRAVANGISSNMGAKGAFAMVRLLVQLMPTTR